jgi:hypothetical protein
MLSDRGMFAQIISLFIPILSNISCRVYAIFRCGMPLMLDVRAEGVAV